MVSTVSRMLLDEIAAALDMAPAGDRARFTAKDRLASCFPVTELAGSTMGAACLAISELIGETNGSPAVSIDLRLASLWFGFTIKPRGWELPSPWDAVAGDYRTRDGWIKLHTNAPHHKAAALSVLDCKPTREAFAEAVAGWTGGDLELAIVNAGGCAAKLRGRSEWLTHPQGKAAATEPLVLCGPEDSACTTSWRPAPSRPLAGLRVLDLTRVLAGPVATRFLAGFGAQVLRIDPPDWDEPGVVPEVTLGKRCARLDLRSDKGRRTFERLLSQAHILVHGYRSDALDRLGFDFGQRQTIRPGLIDVSLDAYGHGGPWRARRGFDSLVQFSSGIAAEGMAWKQSATPVSLPVQALDQATGHLMAAAAIRGLIAQLRGEPRLRFRVSLARTAELLFRHRSPSISTSFEPAGNQDMSDVIETTAWGMANRLRPAAFITGAPMKWTTGAAALGSSRPEWSNDDR